MAESHPRASWTISHRPTRHLLTGAIMALVLTGCFSPIQPTFSNLPANPGRSCLPVTSGDPKPVTTNYSVTTGNRLVDQNANKLWAQAAAGNEQPVTTTLLNAKQATYNGIAMQLQQTNPAVYSLFQGDQWTTRLEIGFEALFAAVAAGLLIVLTLIILKLGFLLLLVAGPFFLIIGVHPGFGRVVAIRWFEMLVGVLMKQVAVALTLSVLLYCYSLIMGTTDQVLPWALKIMMIALVTVAVFIYRRPFQHLFSSVGYGMLGCSGLVPAHRQHTK